PHQVAVIVECLTDNKNRTASEVKLLFKAGQMGTPGSVAWMFDRVGIVEGSNPDRALDLESVAIEAGAQNVESMAEEQEEESDQLLARFFSDPNDLDTVNKFLSANGWEISKCELGYAPKNLVALNGDQEKEVVEFLQDMDENDDVHRVYAAIK
ncbi:MAG: YebC/PmpR family DNA-binding transcriptional regulator, partial [Bdellovibrionales bacterium]|nr:YebC/PmpR family DNA-binding transcriptional regulator [Bdellovibrionales bacterium]